MLFVLLSFKFPLSAQPGRWKIGTACQNALIQFENPLQAISSVIVSSPLVCVPLRRRSRRHFAALSSTRSGPLPIDCGRYPRRHSCWFRLSSEYRPLHPAPADMPCRVTRKAVAVHSIGSPSGPGTYASLHRRSRFAGRKRKSADRTPSYRCACRG